VLTKAVPARLCDLRRRQLDADAGKALRRAPAAFLFGCLWEGVAGLRSLCPKLLRADPPRNSCISGEVGEPAADSARYCGLSAAIALNFNLSSTSFHAAAKPLAIAIEKLGAELQPFLVEAALLSAAADHH